MVFDPSGDFVVFDGSETLIYTRPGQAVIAVPGALREQLSVREASAGAALGIAPADVPFNIPGPNLAGLKPAAGDWFTTTDNSNGWTIVSVQYDILTQQYRAICRARR